MRSGRLQKRKLCDATRTDQCLDSSSTMSGRSRLTRRITPIRNIYNPRCLSSPRGRLSVVTGQFTWSYDNGLNIMEPTVLSRKKV